MLVKATIIVQLYWEAALSASVTEMCKILLRNIFILPFRRVAGHWGLGTILKETLLWNDNDDDNENVR